MIAHHRKQFQIIGHLCWRGQPFFIKENDIKDEDFDRWFGKVSLGNLLDAIEDAKGHYDLLVKILDGGKDDKAEI